MFNESSGRKGVSLERLQTLRYVVEAGGIMAAAKGDPNRQSLISRQIGELEGALGIALLDRKARPHRPTPEAVRLADSCARFARDVEELAAEAVGNSLPIRVGAGELVIREVLIPWIGGRRKSVDSVSWVMRNLTSREIQEELAAERLDVGLSAGLDASGTVKVKDVAGYGMKLVLPEGMKPVKDGWRLLKDLRVTVLEGDGSFRRFLRGLEAGQGDRLRVGAECTSYPQAVDLAEAAGWAVFVPELWWGRRKEWKVRTQALPGLEAYRHVLRLGWNERVSKRRPEVARLVDGLGKGRNPVR